MVKKFKVAVDIGHGKNTFPPSKGVYKNGKAYHEHDFNSKVAVQLEKNLKDYEDIEVIMYQKPFSNEIGLVDRTNYYNKEKVDLVWSIHANAGNEAADGRCAFYWHTAKEAKELAEMFAKEVKNAGYTTHGNGTHASKPNSWTNLHICRETVATAVLTENGFMTNDEVGTDDDFELVFGSKQDEYVKDIAHIHEKVITKFFGLKKNEDKKEDNKQWYRVRKSWEDYKSQKGAFYELQNAKDLADKNKGYKVYDEDGKVVYGKDEVKSDTKPKSQPKPKGDMKTNSIVTYLNSIDEDSSFSNRGKLARANGIKGYKGTAEQNLKLLSILRDGKDGSKPKSNPYEGKWLRTKTTVRFYYKPSWSDGDVAGRVTKGLGFPKVIGKTKVGSSYQYRVQNSKGQTFYITAHSKYVYLSED